MALLSRMSLVTGPVRIASALVFPVALFGLSLTLTIVAPGLDGVFIFLPFYLILFPFFSGVFAGLVAGYRAALPLGAVIVLIDRLFLPTGPWLFTLFQAGMAVVMTLIVARLRIVAAASRAETLEQEASVDA